MMKRIRISVLVGTAVLAHRRRDACRHHHLHRHHAWQQAAVPGHGLRSQQDWALTAGELMSSPAITISADATIASAARTMNAHHVRRLPVVDSGGCLLGIVTEPAAAHPASAGWQSS